MRSINKVILIGNLTRDPETRATPNGQTVTTFGIATNREWVTKDKDKKNSAEFHECVAWAHLAEICQKYLKKGRLIYIEGYLKTRNWVNQEGQKRFKTEIVIQDLIMLEKRQNEEDYIPAEEIAEEGIEEAPVNAIEESAEPEMSAAVKAENKPETPKIELKVEKKEEKKEENPIDKDLGL